MDGNSGEVLKGPFREFPEGSFFEQIIIKKATKMALRDTFRESHFAILVLIMRDV